MASKGIAWLPVAIGIFFLAQILIFSFAFTQVTILARAVTDSNIIFEGDELETYVRSITNAVEISTAQSVYDFYFAHKDAQWQFVLQPSQVPTEGQVTSELETNVLSYMGEFVSRHDLFKEAEDIGIESSEGVTVSVEENNIYSRSPDSVTLTKNLEDFGEAGFTRKFVPEATLITVFGEIMEKIREVVEKDMIGEYAVNGIGMPGSVQNPPPECSVEYRDGLREQRSYIDQDPGCTDPSGRYPSSGSCWKSGQTVTTGTKRYCSSQTLPRVCAEENPCPPPPYVEPPPTPPEVYSFSHSDFSYGSAAENIKSYSYNRLLCLESVLDYDSTDYTVAFDGDNRETDLGEPKIEVKSQVRNTGCYEEDVGSCDGYRGDPCAYRDGTPIKWWYTCHVLKDKICTYDHLVDATVEARFQEDGFVYGLRRGDSMVADNLKVVFKAESGNEDLK